MIVRPAHTPWGLQIPAPEEMRRAEDRTIKLGTSALDLMERAGRAIGKEIGLRITPGSTPIVLCGHGNNGGDGLVVARTLLNEGFSPVTVIISSKSYSPLVVVNARAFVNAGGSLFLFGSGSSGELTGLTRMISNEELARHLSHASVVVDALLGIGQKGDPRGLVRSLVELVGIHSIHDKVVAIDVPTGIDSDEGKAFSPHVSATTTYAVECIKRGMLQYPARALCGKIFAIPIGISCDHIAKFELLSPRGAILAARSPESHKGNFGRVLVVGGCNQYPGAPVLAALGALRAGAGIVTLSAPSTSLVPLEVTILPSSRSKDGALQLGSLVDHRKALPTYNSVIIGPGLGQSNGTREFLIGFLKAIAKLQLPAVIDADALNLIAPLLNRAKIALEANWVVTPHPGEASRLLGCSTTDVQTARYHAAQALAERTTGVVLLKGAGTIVCNQERGFVLSQGTPYLATPGSGDVLSGVIGALLAQGFDPLTAASIGASLHASAGEKASQRTGGTIVATDIASAISEAVGDAYSRGKLEGHE